MSFFSCFFVSVFFFDEENLTKKGAGPGDWGGILLLYNYDNYLFFFSCFFFFCEEKLTKKMLVRVIGKGFCYYITMTTICFFQLLLFLFWGKTDQKRRWSRWSGRGCVGRTPRHSGVSPERREKGRLCRIERNWRRYERQIKLQSRVSSSDAKCWCHTL